MHKSRSSTKNRNYEKIECEEGWAIIEAKAGLVAVVNDIQLFGLSEEEANHIAEALNIIEERTAHLTMH